MKTKYAKLKFWRWSRRGLVVAAAVVVVVFVLSGASYAMFFAGIGQPSGDGSVNLQKGLVGYWKLDGNAKDSTPYGNNGTINGATLTADRFGKENAAYAFNGTTSSIAIGASPAFTHSLPFTVSAWFDGIGPTNGALLNKYLSSSSNGFNLFFGSSQHICAWYFNHSNYTAIAASQGFGASCPVVSNTWHMVTVTVSTIGMTMYIDGVQAATSGWTGTPGASSETTPINFGCYNSHCFSGTIDDVRIYSRAININEVKALYNSYDPGVHLGNLQKGLVGYWKLDGNAKDSSPYGNNGTLVNSPTPTADREGKASSAMSFSSTTADNVTIPYNPVFAPTSAATISLWFKPTNVASTSAQKIISNTEAGGYALAFTGNNTVGPCSPNMFCFFIDLSGYRGVQVPASTFSNNLWYHVTGLYDGTNLSLYINGKLAVTTTAQKGYTITESSTRLCFAAESQPSSCSGDNYSGSINDVRIYNRGLSAGEISQLYDSYNSQINLGTSGGSSGQSVNLTKGLVGYWPFNGNAKDATPYSNNGTVTGATLTTDRFGNANSAYQLGNTNEYISVGSPATYSNLTTTGFTYNIWLMRTADSTYKYPEIMGADATHYYYGIRSQTSGGSIAFEFGKAPYDGSSFTALYIGSMPSDGTWHMYTVTYDGTTIKTYKDGVYAGQAATALNPSFGGLDFSDSNAEWNGTMDDARVYNRPLSSGEIQALYNSN